jgi:hypothetical protein
MLVRSSILRAIALGALLTVCGAIGPAIAEAPSREARTSAPVLDLKCAYLYNFARFTNWPGSVFPSAAAPFTFAVLGDPDLAASLRRHLDGKRLDGRPIVVTEAATPADGPAAQMVYIGGGREKVTGEILATCERRAILTVSESPSFLRQGGVIRLVQRDENLVFEINQHAATSAGLQISSRLLQLARAVVGAGS